MKKDIIFIPGNWHPYIKCLSKQFIKRGYSYIPCKNFSDDILSSKIDAIHFHWIEYFYNSKNISSSIRNLLGLLFFLRKAKKTKKKIIWTVHNHWPHDSNYILTSFYILSLFLFSRFSDIIVVHSKWSKNFIKHKYRPKSKIIVMYHGNFIGYFNPIHNLNPWYQFFSLNPNKKIISLIGPIRPYKNYKFIINTIAEYLMKDDLQLFIAGKIYDKSYLDHLISIAKKRKIDMVCLPKALNDTEYTASIQVSNLLLLPYKQITTSGALLASFSLGRSVLASKLPYFHEILPTKSPAGFLYTPNNPYEFSISLKELINISSNIRENCAYQKAQQYDWDLVTQDFFSILESILQEN